MLLITVVLLSLLGPCFTEGFWDPTDSRCEEYRNDPGRREWWNGERSLALWHDNGFLSYLEKGCNEYEQVKKTDDYKCWPKDFLCSARQALQVEIDGENKKKNYHHQSWYGWFDKVGNHQKDDRDQEIGWIVDMRWNDPRLLFWEKDNLEDIGKQMFDRIFFYVEKNNIDSLELVFDHYKSKVMEFMRQQCVKVNEDETKIQCKLVKVFDTLVGLMIDHNDISWNPRGGSIPPRNREELAMLYLLEPKVYQIMNIGESKARNKTLCHRLMTMFQSFFDNTLSKNGQNIKEHFGKFGSIHVIMQRSCNEAYNNDFENIVCYIAETFSRMTKLTTALGTDFSNWESDKSQTMRAAVLIWHLLTPKGNFYVKVDATKKAKSALELLKITYSKIRGNKIEELQEITSLIPTEAQMGLTSSDLCSPSFERISKSMKCAYKIMVENLVMFLGQYSSKDQKTKRIDLSVNHKTRLEQFQISSIKDTVENTKLELKSSLEEFTRDLKQYMDTSMGKRFESLQQYFDSMANFDLEIAQADTAFITGKLDSFTKTSNELSKKLEYDALKLQFEGTAIKVVDSFFMWMKVIGSGISAMVGLFKGDFGGFADTADRIDAAAKTTLEAIKGGAIREQIKISTDKFKEIADGFKENREQLENVKKIIDKLKAGDVSSDEFKQISKDFIQSYNDYTPKVRKDQLVELDSAWNQVADNLESLYDSMETKEAITGSTYAYVENHFFKIKLVVPRLSETLSNRFDFQFDLMDSLTATVRAHTSIQAAKGLSEGFPQLDEQVAKSIEVQLALEQMALSTYVLSQFHLLLILSQYCNYVTYINAGVESSQCARALSTMNTLHIDEALSFSPPSCDTVDVNLRIPTSKTGKSDSINLPQLNSGKEVFFQIPNFEWLKLNGEMSGSDEGSALFVKRFELYALTNDDYQIKRDLRVEVTPGGSAPLHLGQEQTKYEFVPVSRTQYVFEYKENYLGNCKGSVNPYSVCSPGPKEICFKSRGEISNELKAYPSIYSPWIIKLDNIGNVPNPAPETTLYLQAKLQLCRKRKDSNERSKPGRKRFLKKLKKRKHHPFKYADAQSCPDGKYYNQDIKQFVACPVDSAPQRSNYYCEVNKKSN